MQEIKNDELLSIIGGFSLTGTLINAVTNAAKFLYSTGQALGSSFRRIGGSSLCPLK